MRGERFVTIARAKHSTFPSNGYLRYEPRFGKAPVGPFVPTFVTVSRVHELTAAFVAGAECSAGGRRDLARTSVIDRMTRELKGEVRRTWRAEGLSCQIVLQV